MKSMTKTLALLSVTILISACGGGRASFIKQPIATTSYYCESSLPLFTTSYSDDTLDLTYANRTIILVTPAGGPRQIYSNANLQWQIKGDSGILYSMKPSGERGGRIDICKAVPVSAATADKNPISSQQLPVIAEEPRPQPIGSHTENMPETMTLE